VFDYPSNGRLGVPMTNQISKAYLLAEPKKTLKITAGVNRSEIQLPKYVPDTINTVVVIEFSGEPIIKPSPTAGKEIVVSSQNSYTYGGKNLLDGDRLTQWEAAKGERNATIEINLQIPTSISTLIVDEPWHPWDNKMQKLVLQYKLGNEWKTIVETATKGTGLVQKFKPVIAQIFRMKIENKDGEPTLSEWQLYGPE
jgi:alpha-L-fucosidase